MKTATDRIDFHFHQCKNNREMVGIKDSRTELLNRGQLAPMPVGCDSVSVGRYWHALIFCRGWIKMGGAIDQMHG